MKLAIITTHPVQYYAPVFKLLSKSETIEIKVYYTLGWQGDDKWDTGFAQSVKWDIPLFDGYVYEWVKNTSKTPGSDHFNGIINPDLIEQLKNWQPDALLVYGWAYHGHLKVIRYFKNKVPVYFRGDSTLLINAGIIKKTLRFIFLKWVYRHVDHAFYVGTNNKLYFKNYGLKDHQLSFAPHAIDNLRFKTDQSAEAKKIRLSFNISNDDVVVLYAGKFDRVKNLKFLITAFNNLSSPNTHLLFVGNGIAESELKKHADKSNKAHCIHFSGFVNQSAMPAIYNTADLFCLPSVSETWGLSVNEAMACGKAVLVSDKCGCAVDLVIPNITGNIFETESLSDLTAKLELLVRDKDLLKILGTNARDEITGWSFETQADNIINVINKSIAN